MSKSVVLIAEDFPFQHQILIEKLNSIGVETITCDNNAVMLEVSILKYAPSIVVFNSSSLGFDCAKKLIKNIRYSETDTIYYNIYTYEDAETLKMLEKIGITINTRLPCNFDAVASHIKLIIDTMPLDINSFKDIIHERLVNILSDFNMTSRQLGRDYIVTAIMYILFEKHIRPNFNGEIYPYIAKKYNSKPLSVEHSIRIAITKSWNNTDEAVKKLYFQFCDVKPNKPTNAEFILTIADFVRDENNTNFRKARQKKFHLL